METYDYVIVGAGSAGSVLANRLTADGSTSVCVLEAGGRDWHPYIHIPAGFIKTYHDPRVNWLYSMEPGPWTGGRRILAPRGGALQVDQGFFDLPHGLSYPGAVQRSRFLVTCLSGVHVDGAASAVKQRQSQGQRSDGPGVERGRYAAGAKPRVTDGAAQAQAWVALGLGAADIGAGSGDLAFGGEHIGSLR